MSRLMHFDLSAGEHQPAMALAKTLAALLPPKLNRTIFTNSGSEAVEAAIRIAHEYWALIGDPRTRLITFEVGYHGSTMLCQALSGLPLSTSGSPLGFPVTRVPLPVDRAAVRKPENLALLLTAFAEALDVRQHGPACAVIVEPLLNVGGGIVLPSGFLSGLRSLCDKSGTLLCLDEVFTGFGRTGEMFAFESSSVVPDIIVTSKGLSGGHFPLAATTVTEKIYSVVAEMRPFNGLSYGHTTSGHAVGCAVAQKVLEIIKMEQLVPRSRMAGDRIRTRIRTFTSDHRLVDVRGAGMVTVIEANSDLTAGNLASSMLESGLLARLQGSTIMLAPPLNISDTEVEELLCNAEKAFKKVFQAR